MRPLLKSLLTLTLFTSACGPDKELPCLETSGNICPVAGSGKAGVGAEGEPALQTELFQPQDVTLGPDGLLYVVDFNNHRVRAVDAEGIIRTVIGTGTIGDASSAPPLEVSLYSPTDVTFDAQGRLVLAAWRNNKVMRIEDGVLQTVAGTGHRAYTGDGGAAVDARLDFPSSAVVAADGAIYFSDQGNRRVRRVGTDGIITTVVGNGEGGFGGDGGPALSAQLEAPTGQAAAPSGKLALGPDGVLYIADSGNQRVRRVGTDGVITTFAGTGEAAAGPDGVPATESALSRPTDVAVGPDGSVFVADTDNSCVRRISPEGVITTVAGICGEAGAEGDGGSATQARLNRPFGIHVDAQGRLFIADTGNHRVRVVVP